MKSKIMHFLRKSLGALLLFLSGTACMAGTFEGSIKFVKKSFYDTTFLQYYIKDHQIRIDKYGRQGGELIETLLVDLEKQTVTAVNPIKKLYRPLTIASEDQAPNQGYKIIKTGNFREINGVRCYQWRVRNRRLNSEIAYWVTQTQFDFYDDLLTLLKRTERIYRFFIEIPGNEGFFPMLSVERTLLRDERERVVVQQIDEGSLSERLFKIPDDYTELVLSPQIQS